VKQQKFSYRLVIGSRQCAVHRAIDEARAPKSPKGGSKREFLHLALPFISSLQVIVDISNLICALNIASPSLRMTKRPEMGVATSRDPFYSFSSPKICLERLKPETSNLVYKLIIESPSLRMTNCPERGRSHVT